MAILDGNYEALHGSVVEVAKLCALAALKAPKLTGTEIKTKIIMGEEDVRPIVDVMEILGAVSAFVQGDAQTIKQNLDAGTPPTLLLVGVNAAKSPVSWEDCGACGFGECGEFNRHATKNFGAGTLFAGPSCMARVIDHGIAMSWAAAAAWHHHVDNRLQASTGVGAFLLGYMQDVSLVVSLTMGPPGFSIYYDRKSMKRAYTDEVIQEMLMRNIPALFQGFPGDGLPKLRHSKDWMADWRFTQVGKNPEFEAKNQEVMEKLQAYLGEFQAKRQIQA